MPLEEFDLLSERLVQALKKKQYDKALPIIDRIEASGHDVTPSLIYFKGVALQNLGRLDEAEATYRAYLSAAGRSGAYYKKALGRVIEIEDQFDALIARHTDLLAKPPTPAIDQELAAIEESLGPRAEPLKAARAAALAERRKRAAEKAKREAAEAAAKAEAAKRTPGHRFKDCDTCPEMVVVPAGRFTMGAANDDDDADNDETPAHAVTIARPFSIGVYEVTHAEFSAFLEETGYNPGVACKKYEERLFGSNWIDIPKKWPSPRYAQTPRHPAACIAWDDAKAFTAWLSKSTGEVYRLPTEAEWEYAARAGTRTQFFYGNDPYGDSTCKNANTGHRHADCTDNYVDAAPVGRFRPNRFGLYDVHGNIQEWVEDCYIGSYETTPVDGSAHIVNPKECNGIGRGGSYHWWWNEARSASRQPFNRELRVEFLGFRVVRDIK